jgi:hypothetical protein
MIEWTADWQLERNWVSEAGDGLEEVHPSRSIWNKVPPRGVIAGL